MPLFYENPEFDAAMEAYVTATTDEDKDAPTSPRPSTSSGRTPAGCSSTCPLENLGLAPGVEGVPARFDEFFFVEPGRRWLHEVKVGHVLGTC